MLISKAKIEEFKRKNQPSSELSGRVRAYQRVSGDGVGQDIARQVKMFRDFINNYEGVEETGVYREISTSKGGYVRKKFEDMKLDAKANKFDIIWVDQVSRLGRDVREGLNSVFELMECGLRVYIEQFNKVFDPTNDNDVAMLTMYFLVSQTEHRWNARQTKLSMETKRERLEKHGVKNNLLNIRMNNPTPFDQIIEDPFHDAEKSPKKLGIANIEIPHMKEMFTQWVMCGDSWSTLSEKFRKPVNPKCKYGCFNGKEMPFGGLAREKGNREKGWKKTKRSEVGKFITSGGWKNFIKKDSEIDQKAFVTKTGQKRVKRMCGCGQKMSEVTICRWKKEICYETGAVEKVRPDAFVRKDASSHEVSLDELEALILSGKVSST